MSKRTVLFKKECTYAQTPGMTSVKQLMIVGENGKKYLALRCLNERSEPVSALDMTITEFDEDGRTIASDTFDIDASGGAGETFIPDQKIELEDNTADCVVVVKSARYGAYIYRAVKNKAVAEYSGSAPEKAPVAVRKDYADKAGKDGITVKPRKLKAPLLVVFAMIISLVATAFAAYFHMLYFVKHEKTFLHAGVEYSFANGDSSDGTDIYAVGYYGNRARIVIPEKIDGHVVKGISDGAFAGNNSLVGIKFESELPVGKGAFENCGALTDVEFEKITSFGAGAFKSCAMLKSVDLREDIKEIPAEAFYGCTHLKNINVAASSEPVIIGRQAFANCTELDGVEFLRRIDYGDSANRDYFAGSSIRSLHILNYDFLDKFKDSNKFAALFDAQKNPQSVRVGELKIDYLESVPESFLRDASSVTSFDVRFVENADIGDHAFDGCENLSDFHFPVAVSGVGAYAFSSSGIKEFDGSALASLGDFAFFDCDKLETFTFTGNSALTDLGRGAFSGCGALTRITLPEKVTQIPADAFSGCGALYDVRVAGEGNIYGIGTNAFSGCEAFTAFPELGVGLSDINSGAFANCTGFSRLVVPDTVAYIGVGAFSGCNGLTSLTLPFIGSNINGGNGYLAHVFGGRSFQNYELVPSALKSVTVTRAQRIYPNAFYRSEGLTEIKLPETLTTIGNRAFYGCKGLAEALLPSALGEIAQEAFYGCAKLVSVDIPDSVTDIGAGAFGGCDGLEKISMPYAVGLYNGNNFVGNIFGAEKYESAGSFAPSKLREIAITRASVIPDYAFYGLVGLESITLADGVSSIGNYAFYDCRSLEKLVVPGSVVRMGYGMLIGTEALEELSVPFAGAYRYGGIVSGSAVENQLQYFYYRSEFGSYYSVPRALKRIVLTDSANIAPYAFANCLYLEQLVLDCDVTNIFSNAVASCYRLHEIFNGSGLKLTVGDAGYGGIAQNVLRVHDSADAQPLPQFVDDDGYRFTDCDGEWYLIDYPADMIGNNASVDLPVSVGENKADTYKIRRYLFFGTDVAKVDIPRGVTEIGECAFCNAYALTDAVFAVDSPITELKSGAFSNCSMLYNVTLPDGLKAVGDSAFAYCSRLKKIKLGKTLTRIDDNAFYGCRRLFEVYNYSELEIVKGSYENGAVALNAREVYDGERLENDPDIGLPNVISGGVQYIMLGDDDIDWWAVDYYGTDGVLELKPFNAGGAAVSSVGIIDGAFYGLRNVRRLIIGNVISTVGDQFTDCFGVTEVTLKANGGAYDEITIASGAFALYSLEKFSSELNVKTVESGAFDSPELKEIEFKGKVGSVKQNAVINANAYDGLSVGFADVGAVERGAFADLAALKTFTAGNTESIGERAFAGCYGLASVTFGNVNYIGTEAFYNCSALEKATFAGVKELGNNAFGYCVSLKSADIASAEDLTTGASAFASCTSLESFVYSGNIGIGAYAFSGCESLRSVELASVSDIGSNAFSGCAALADVKFNGSVQSVGAYAFNNLGNLRSVEFGGNTGAVSAYAFSSCYNLSTVRFAGNVNAVESYAFYSCTQLKTAEFCGTLTALANNAFTACVSLEKIVLPDSLTRIPDNAFSYCSGLREVYLPRNLTSIAQSAFGGCPNILLVYNPSGIESVEAYFDDPVAIVTNKADATVKYVETVNGAQFANIKGEWYFLGGFEYAYGYAFVPRSFNADGATVDKFKLAKHSVDLWGIAVVSTSVTGVMKNAFASGTVVFYEGTPDEWKKIAVGGVSNTVCYKKDCIHEGESEYWRYENNIPVQDITVLDDALWKTVKDATCVRQGEQEAVCPDCGKKQTRILDYLEHDLQSGKCKNCGAEAATLTAANIDSLRGVTITNNGFSVSDKGEIVSGNHSAYSTSTFAVKVEKNTDVSFDYSVSTTQNDMFYIRVNDVDVVRIAGNSGKYHITLRLKAGDELTFSYGKGAVASGGKDAASVENFTVIYTEDRVDA